MLRLALALSSLALLATPAAVAAAPPAVPGELLVRFAPSADGGERAALRQRAGAASARALRGLPGLQLVRLAPGRSVAGAVRSLEAAPGVAYAEPNFRLTFDGPPNDPLFRDQWHLEHIGAPHAWDLTPGSRDVVVAVFDTGVEIRHPDLQDNLWTNPGESGEGREANGADDDGNGYVDDWRGWSYTYDDNDPADYNGHGTHVAGIIGAVGDNGIGISGVSPRVRIMPFALWAGSAGGLVDAIAYAKSFGVRVANGSFGIPRSHAIEDALAAAPDLLLSVSAGNQAWDVEENPEERHPCVLTLPNVICVAATDGADQLAGFSNWGATSVDLGAPGTDLVTVGLPRRQLFVDEFDAPVEARWAVGGTGGEWAARSGEHDWPESWVGGWLEDSPDGPYPPDADSWIATAAPVDLTAHSGCVVGYYLYRELAAGDALRVEASAAGEPWALLAEHTGTESFRALAQPLAAYEGRPGVRMRFRLVSDGAEQGRGVRLDMANIWCEDPPFRGDEYPRVGGTSNAAPHVTGTAALVLAQRPWLTTAQLRAAILDTVQPVPSLAGRTVTGGRLDTLRALGGTWPQPPGEPPAEPPADLPAPDDDLGVPEGDTRAPRCATRLGRPRAARRLKLAVTCDEAAIVGARLRVRRRERTVRLGHTRVPVASAQPASLRIPIGRRRARRLRAERPVRVALVLTAVDAAGNRRRTVRRVTLR